jgi:hypothetical protein
MTTALFGLPAGLAIAVQIGWLAGVNPETYSQVLTAIHRADLMMTTPDGGEQLEKTMGVRGSLGGP